MVYSKVLLLKKTQAGFMFGNNCFIDIRDSTIGAYVPFLQTEYITDDLITKYVKDLSAEIPDTNIRLRHNFDTLRWFRNSEEISPNDVKLRMTIPDFEWSIAGPRPTWLLQNVNEGGNVWEQLENFCFLNKKSSQLIEDKEILHTSFNFVDKKGKNGEKIPSLHQVSLKPGDKVINPTYFQHKNNRVLGEKNLYFVEWVDEISEETWWGDGFILANSYGEKFLFKEETFYSHKIIFWYENLNEGVPFTHYFRGLEVAKNFVNHMIMNKPCVQYLIINADNEVEHV
jgi:hypothetical protein